MPCCMCLLHRHGITWRISPAGRPCSATDLPLPAPSGTCSFECEWKVVSSTSLRRVDEHPTSAPKSESDATLPGLHTAKPQITTMQPTTAFVSMFPRCLYDRAAGSTEPAGRHALPLGNVSGPTTPLIIQGLWSRLAPSGRCSTRSSSRAPRFPTRLSAFTDLRRAGK